MNWINGLKEWRQARDIEVPSGKFYDMIFEELGEYINSKDKHEKVDAIADIIVLAVNEMALEGYDIDKVMDEVVKEISSRQQCPEQMTRQWLGKEKWKKNPNQSKNTLYKANFSQCKIYD